MKRSFSKEARLKEGGIILNYLFLLVGLYAWDLKAFYVILSFVCEYGIIILITGALTLTVGKSWWIRGISAAEVLIGGAILGALQSGFMFLIVSFYPSGTGWHDGLSSYGWSIPAIALPMLILYCLPLRKISDKDERLGLMQTKLFAISIGFLVMEFIGLFTKEVWDPDNIRPVMVSMIISRMALEIYLNHFRGENPKKKKVQN